MAKVSVKDLSSCEKLFTIDVPQEDIQKEYDLFYDEISKVAKIPGFRPGKAPRNVLTIHYAENAKNEVLKKLIPRSLREAFQAKNIFPIGNPSIERVNFESNKLSYDAHVEVRPKIKLDKYTGIQVKQKPLLIQDSEVEEVIKRVQDSQAKFVPVENRAAEMGDYLNCDYVCSSEGKEIEKRTEEMIALREKDFLEGFSKQLLGVKPGESREVHVKFPDNYLNKIYAGKEGVFQVNVKEVKKRELPPLDDELAKSAGDFQTLADLRNKIRTEIESKKKQDQAIELENTILDELIKKSKFEIPKRMVERRLEAIVEEIIHSMHHQGMNEKDEEKKRAEIREKYKQEAEKQVRISFILDEIAQRENIKPAPEDFKAKYQNIAERYARPVEEIEAHFEKIDSGKESLALQIVTEKVLQFLKDNAVVKNA